jgi:tRNA threonylcarbamoyl adenosine modification protein (Sua5/YciO/YrdC/YwlC family)
MKKININQGDCVEEVVKVLEEGGIVMHPTETCYGLAVDVLNKEGLEKLYRVKGREAHKPVSILVDGLGMAEEYGIFSEKALELARKYWPGALSLVVPRKRVLPEFFNEGEDFVSIRCSSDAFCKNMVREFGSPVTTTSANLAGMEPLYVADLSGLGGMAPEIDLVVDAGDILGNKPSTVVKVYGNLVQVLRQGDVVV